MNDAEDAWAAAQEIGLPVVVKPQDGNQGRGVAHQPQLARTGHRPPTPRRLAKAATCWSRNTFPATIIACSSSADASWLPHDVSPRQVVGDGLRTVAELVRIVNTDPRRGDDHATTLSKIPLDAVSLGVLNDQGLTPESIPAAGPDRPHPPQCEPEHRRHHALRCYRSRASRGGRPRHGSRPRRGARHRRRGRRGLRHQPTAGRTARRNRRSQRRPQVSACTFSRRSASADRSAKQLST